MEDNKKKFVLVTGASSGIGEKAVRLLSGNNYYVFAGVHQKRDVARFVSLKNEQIIPLHLDVLDENVIRRAFKIISRRVKQAGLFGLINNAGVAVSSPLEILPEKEIRHQFDVNFFGYFRMIQASLPLIRQGKGRIINIGSVSGRIAGPFLGAYSAAKFAVRALSDSLRLELASFNIRVVLIEPGRIKTPIWQKSLDHSEKILQSITNSSKKYYLPLLKRMNSIRKSSGDKGLDPVRVAEVILKALNKDTPRNEYLVGTDAKLLAFLIRFLPERIIWRQFLKKNGDGSYKK